MKEYVRLCPVCGAIAAPETTQCESCGTLLLGVDLSLRQDAPAPTPEPLPAAAVEGLQCPYEDCGALNAPGSASCLYCGRPMTEAGAVPPAPTFVYRLPSALAEKFHIVEMLPAGGAEAEIMILAGNANPSVKVVAKLYRPGIVPNTEVLERIAQAGFGHVVHLISHGVSEGIHYEVMEYCPAGSLRTLMNAGPAQPLRRDELRQVVAELAEALAALHGIDVIHRDLKPENILVRRREPLDLVLSDFGIASVLEATQHFTGMARSIKYSAPEALSGVLDRAADWWSLGMILVELLTGRHPFDGLSDAVITHRLVTAGVDLSGIEDPDWRKLCRGLLLRDPQKRWGTDEVRRWLDGDANLLMPQEDSDRNTHQVLPYRLGDALCHTPEELATALARHWDAGRKDLMRGQIEVWVETELKDQNLLRFLRDLREQRDVKEDVRLLRLILHLAPGLPPVWRGHPLAVAGLVAQCAKAVQGDLGAADWVVSLFQLKVLHELSPSLHPDAAALALRWEEQHEHSLALWQETTQARTDLRNEQTRINGAVNFDALVYGEPAGLSKPSPLKTLPMLLLALTDPGYADELRDRIRRRAAEWAAHAPWLERLLASEEPAAWVMAHFFLPYARDAAQAEQKRRQSALDAEAARLAGLAAHTNETLARLRDACEFLGVFASDAERANTAAACADLLGLIAEARAAGVPAEAPLMRTLRRAEPIVLRIQDRLDAWNHAARINALWRNRNLAEGAGGFFAMLFMFATQVMSRLLIWLILIPAAIFGWRLWGILGLRNAIRELGRTLPVRIPTS